MRFYGSILPILINIIVASLITHSISSIFSITVDEILRSSGIERFMLIIIANLFLVYTFIVIIKYSRKNEIKLSKTEFTLTLITFILSMIMFSFITSVSMKIQATTYVSNLLLGCNLGLVIMNIVVFYLVSQLGKLNAIKLQNELLLQQAKYQEKYTEEAKKQHQATMHVQHDIKHSLAVVGVLLDEQKYDKAKLLLMEYMGSNAMSAVILKTENDALNAIVSLKFTYAQSLGIKTFCALPAIFSLLGDIDLCNLLGNMLDNAIEYCQNHSNKDNEISVMINFTEINCSIVVTNTLHTSVLAKNKNLLTTKPDKAKHGLGIETIKSIAKKHHGLFDCYEENDLFFAKVVLFLDIH